MLFNLVGNAVKFTSNGSIILKIKKEINNDTKSLKIRFSVEDTGVGMSEEKLGHLFQPFNQIQKVGTSGEPGSGLGLSISQYLVKAMDGEIKVSSEFDRGSKFWFTLEFKDFSNENIDSVLKKASSQKVVTRAQIERLFEKDD